MSPAHELCTLIDAVRGAARDGQPAALATITATRGSTFRHAGARMLVRGDGRVVCELSGGCPQHDIVQRALRAISGGHPELARYNSESGLDVLMEQGCGGELDVLIEPLEGSRCGGFFDALADCLESRDCALAATLFMRNGRVEPPRRALWCNEESCFDEIGDRDLHEAIACAAATDDAPYAVTLQFPIAGEKVEVLIERIEPPHALFAIGHGATARALVAAGHALGWQTTLVAPDPSRVRAADLPHATRVVCVTARSARERLALDRRSSVVVVTHNLAQDLAWLDALGGAPVAYLGAIGSRERTSHIRADVSPPIPNLHAPAGLDIGSETPAEIALAVVAEIIAAINGRNGAPLRDGDGDLHG